MERGFSRDRRARFWARGDLSCSCSERTGMDASQEGHASDMSHTARASDPCMKRTWSGFREGHQGHTLAHETVTKVT